MGTATANTLQKKVAAATIEFFLEQYGMKVTVDRSACVSCGSCWDTCPGFFEENPDDTFSQIVGKFRLEGRITTGQPPADLESCAQDAADLCPVQIITIGD